MPSGAYGQSPMFQMLLAEKNKREEEHAANKGKSARVASSITGGIPLVGGLTRGIISSTNKGTEVNPETPKTQPAPPAGEPASPSPSHLGAQQFTGAPPPQQNLYPLNTPPPTSPPPPGAGAPPGGLGALIRGAASGAGVGAAPKGGTAGASGSGLPWLVNLLLQL